jgi:hypothetical protein
MFSTSRTQCKDDPSFNFFNQSADFLSGRVIGLPMPAQDQLEVETENLVGSAVFAGAFVVSEQFIRGDRSAFASTARALSSHRSESAPMSPRLQSRRRAAQGQFLPA